MAERQCGNVWRGKALGIAYVELLLCLSVVFLRFALDSAIAFITACTTFHPVNIYPFFLTYLCLCKAIILFSRTGSFPYHFLPPTGDLMHHP